MNVLRVIEQLGRGPNLIVLLPGAYMRAHDFIEADFMHAVALSRLALDVKIVDIDFVHTCRTDAQSWVRDQVLAPARSQYDRLFLGGISLGGQSALLHAATGEVTLDGLCLMAPYPGSRLAINHIDKAGGLDEWQPTALQLADVDYKIWSWLKDPSRDVPSFIGFGHEDRFADGMMRMAHRLNVDSPHCVSGGHDWSAWKKLWTIFLESGAFLH